MLVYGRNPDGVKDIYEKIWEETLNNIQSQVDNGERNLSRILNLVQQCKTQVEDSSSMDEEISLTLKIPRDERNIPLVRLVAINGKYTLVPWNYKDHTLFAAVADRITEDTEFVVELGSGWGRNLFEIYLRTTFNHPHYVACEITDSGRHATQILSNLGDGIQMTTKFFDFHNPDLSFLQGNPNVIFFTSHAIEQCTTVNNQLFDMMMEKTANCTCVHMEPIGWQRESNEKAKMIKNMIEERKRPDQHFNIDDSKFLENAMIWAIARMYNTNLLEIIERYRQSGRINVDILIYDIFGEVPFNPSTLVVWHKSDS